MKMPMTLDRIQQRKADVLLDMIRRVVANPGNAAKVADAISKDWHPLIVVAKDGTWNFQASE